MRHVFILTACFLLSAGIWMSVQAQNEYSFGILDSRTDSDGSIILSYRKSIYINGSRENLTDHIYEYNLSTGVETMIVEGYHNFGGTKTPLGFVRAGENFENVISFGRFSDLPTYIDFNGNFVLIVFRAFFDALHVSPFEPNVVYAPGSLDEVFISRDGGATWPNDLDIENGTVPDSLLLGFPLISVSPNVEQHMFGFDEQSGQVVRSTDNGQSSEPVLPAFDPVKPFFFTSNPDQVAFIDEDARDRRNREFILYTSDRQGQEGSWSEKARFSSSHRIETDLSARDTVYLWTTKKVMMSTDFGHTFDTIFEVEEGEFFTKFSAIQHRWFIEMTDRIFEWTGSERLPLRGVSVEIENPEDLQPESFELLQNYPNPFNPATTIRFQLPVAQNVTIQVYDVSGRLVLAPIRNERIAAGEYSVSIDFSNGFSSGVYFYTLTTEQNSITRTMTLLK